MAVVQGLSAGVTNQPADDIVVFHPLDKAQILEIAKIQLHGLRTPADAACVSTGRQRVAVARQRGLRIRSMARAPLKSRIQQQLENPLAQKILAGSSPRRHDPDHSPGRIWLHTQLVENALASRAIVAVVVPGRDLSRHFRHLSHGDYDAQDHFRHWVALALPFRFACGARRPASSPSLLRLLRSFLQAMSGSGTVSCTNDSLRSPLRRRAGPYRPAIEDHEWAFGEFSDGRNIRDVLGSYAAGEPMPARRSGACASHDQRQGFTALAGRQGWDWAWLHSSRSSTRVRVA